MNEASNFTLPFLRKEKIAKDVYSFYFDRTTKPDYDFSAGQYTRVLLDLTEDDPRGRSRMFTTCSSPDQKDIFMITTKISDQPSVFKQKMMNLEKGQEVKFFGPMGAFILPEKNDRPMVFLAGGIGITPFHSMLLHAASINYQTSIILIISFSTSEEMVFYDELMQLSRDNPNIKVIYTVSNQGKSKGKWTGEVGRISEEMIKKYISDIFSPTYFIAGPTTMVGSLLDLLQDMKIPPDQIREEQLTGY